MIIILLIGFGALFSAYLYQYKVIKEMKEQITSFEEYAGGAVESESEYQDYNERIAQLRAEIGLDEVHGTIALKENAEILHPLLYNIPDEEVIEVVKHVKESAK